MSALDRHDNGSPTTRGFRLDRHNGKLMGVCAGIGDYFEIDPTLVRIAFVLGTICGVGILVPVYIAIGLIAD